METHAQLCLAQAGAPFIHLFKRRGVPTVCPAALPAGIAPTSKDPKTFSILPISGAGM